MHFEGYEDAKEASRQGKEIWRPLPEYVGIYEVSNLGSVRSVDRMVEYRNGRKHFHPGRVLKESLHEFGYKLVTLCDRERQSSFAVHVLVLCAFSGPKSDETPHTRHLNGHPSDNRLFNLAWGTVQENLWDRITHGTIVVRVGERHHHAKLTIDAVRDIRLRLSQGELGVNLAREYSVSKSTISEVKTRKMWKHIE